MATAKSRGLAMEAILLIAICLFCVFPFYWMVTTSLKTQVVALQSPPAWLFSPTLANYTEVLFEDKVGVALINSIIVAVSTTLLAVILGTPAAYALARFEFRGKTDLWFWFITNRFVAGGPRLPGISDQPRSGPARYAYRADPDVSDLQPAHRDLDLHRSVPVCSA